MRSISCRRCSWKCCPAAGAACIVHAYPGLPSQPARTCGCGQRGDSTASVRLPGRPISITRQPSPPIYIRGQRGPSGPVPALLPDVRVSRDGTGRDGTGIVRDFFDGAQPSPPDRPVLDGPWSLTDTQTGRSLSVSCQGEHTCACFCALSCTVWTDILQTFSHFTLLYVASAAQIIWCLTP